MNGESDVHDVLGMPVHDSVSEIETLEIAHCGSLDLFRKPKVST